MSAERISRRTVEWVLVSIAGLALVGAVAFRLVGSSAVSGEAASQASESTSVWMGAGVQPTAGDEVTLMKAAELAVFDEGVPVLANQSAPSACAPSQSAAIDLLSVFASPDERGKVKTVGQTYTNGVWMAITSLDQYDSEVVVGGAIAPVEEVLKGDDLPSTLFTTNVGAARAWGVNLSGEFKCPEPQSTESPSPGARSDGDSVVATTLDTSKAVIFDPRLTSSLRWVENGVMIHLVGPVALKDLRGLADSLDWQQASK